MVQLQVIMHIIIMNIHVHFFIYYEVSIAFTQAGLIWQEMDLMPPNVYTQIQINRR